MTTESFMLAVVARYDANAATEDFLGAGQLPDGPTIFLIDLTPRKGRMPFLAGENISGVIARSQFDQTNGCLPTPRCNRVDTRSETGTEDSLHAFVPFAQ